MLQTFQSEELIVRVECHVHVPGYKFQQKMRCRQWANAWRVSVVAPHSLLIVDTPFKACGSQRTIWLKLPIGVPLARGGMVPLTGARSPPPVMHCLRALMSVWGEGGVIHLERMERVLPKVLSVKICYAIFSWQSRNESLGKEVPL